jgi:uncharacterized Zn-finger protein
METFVEEEELKIHFRELHSQFSIQLRVAEKPRRGLIQCSLCGSNVTSMKLHRTTQHRMGPAAFQCMVSAKKKQTYFENLMQNKKYVFLKFKKTIQECGRTYRTRKALKNCEAIHLGIRPSKLKCPKCPSIVATRSGLYHHMKLHGEEYIHGCDVCGRQFSKLKYLTQHLATHTGDRRTNCEVCGVKVNKTYIKIHMRIHTGERPFQCNYCEKTFIHNTGM